MLDKYKEENPKGESGIVKSRNQSKLKLFNTLLYGYFELKEAGDEELAEIGSEYDALRKKLKKMKGAGATKYITKIVDQIEEKIFTTFNKSAEKIDVKYRKKLRSLILNLKDENNGETRIKILLVAITAEHLCTMKEEELLTSSERKRRNLARQQYLKAHTVSMTTMQEMRTMIKTHKGMAIIEQPLVDPDDERPKSGAKKLRPQSNGTILAEKPAPELTNLSEEGKYLQAAYKKNPNKVFLPRPLKDALVELSGSKLREDFLGRYSEHFTKAVARKFANKLKDIWVE